MHMTLIICAISFYIMLAAFTLLIVLVSYRTKYDVLCYKYERKYCEEAGICLKISWIILVSLQAIIAALSWPLILVDIIIDNTLG